MNGRRVLVVCSEFLQEELFLFRAELVDKGVASKVIAVFICKCSIVVDDKGAVFSVLVVEGVSEQGLSQRWRFNVLVRNRAGDGQEKKNEVFFHDYPFTFPMGLNATIFLLIPASCMVLMTSEMGLYANPASSARPE